MLNSKLNSKNWHINWLNSNNWGLFFLFVALGFLVRFVDTPAFILGDEISSLNEAQHLGENLQGLPYSVLLRVVLGISESLLVLRLPSIVLGSLAIGFFWRWLAEWRGGFVASVATLLLILNPTAVYTTQQIRFYGLYLFAISFFLYAFQHRERRWLLVVATLLLISAHAFGGVVVVLMFLYWLMLERTTMPRGALLLWGLVVILGVIGLLTQGSDSMINLILLAHQLVLGEFVYPLTWQVVIPSLLIFGGLLLVALYHLGQTCDSRALGLVATLGVLGLVIPFGILDPLTPANFYASISVRHVLWLVLLMVWLVAEGIAHLTDTSYRYASLILVIGIEIVGLSHVYQPTWGAVNYAPSFAKLENFEGVILADPAAEDTLAVNLAGDTPRHPLWESSAEDTIGTPVAIVADDRSEKHSCPTNAVLAQFADRALNYVDVQHPYFAYIFGAGQTSPKTPPFPKTIFHARFADLHLPLTTQWEGQSYTIDGVYSLPDCLGNTTWEWAANGISAENIILFSNIDTALPANTIVAEVVVTTTNGEVLTFPVRQGYETQVWVNGRCDTCGVAYQWRKLAQLRGFSSYPYANREADGIIWGITLSLPGLTNLNTVQIVTTEHTLNIWGLYID